MTVCYWCGAKDTLADIGKELDDGKYKMVQCRKCKNAYYVVNKENVNKPKPLTNEEYIRTCSTAELVHEIHLMTSNCYVCGSDGVDYRRCYFRKKCTGPKEIEEWLKEKHDGE